MRSWKNRLFRYGLSNASYKYKKYFDSIEEGVAEVLVDNEVAKNNICKYAEGCGYNFDASEKEGNYIIKIEKMVRIK